MQTDNEDRVARDPHRTALPAVRPRECRPRQTDDLGCREAVTVLLTFGYPPGTQGEQLPVSPAIFSRNPLF